MIKKYLEKIKPYKAGKPIEEVKRDLGLKRIIKLASNENPFSPSPKVLDVLNRKMGHINRYPDSQCYYLRQELASYYGIDGDNIIFGNGSDELIILALRACAEEGSEIIIGVPSFLIYEIQARAFGIKVVKSPLKEHRYDLNDMKKRITKNTRIIFIANPDNPNGSCLSDKEIKDFMKDIPDDVLVFFDEAYFEFSPDYFSGTLDYVKNKKNVIVSRTFSKAYSLAGLRIGYGIGAGDVMEAINKVKEPFNVNSLAQYAALEALKDKKYLKNCLGYIEKEKQFLYEELGRLGLFYVESSTNFILFNTGAMSSSDIYNKLLSKGIIVRNMSGWGMDNSIRVTIGKHEENQEFIKALEKII